MTNPYIGQVFLFAGDFSPRDYMECKGDLLEVSQNEALFSILGTTYGGDGRTTFALPKISRPEKGGMYVIAVYGRFPPRPNID